MKLDITEIVREPGKSAPYSIEEPPLVDEDIECAAPVTGKIVFTNAGSALIIRGECSTSLVLPCSRCCAYFESALALPIEEEFELLAVGGGPRSLPTITVLEEDESPIAGKLFEGMTLDLTEMLRQYILLNQPMRPLPEEAEGRCVSCGLTPEEVLAKVAAEEPGETSSVHPAFAGLSSLLEERTEEDA